MIYYTTPYNNSTLYCSLAYCDILSPADASGGGARRGRHAGALYNMIIQYDTIYNII